jgi:hypothetical protein
LSRGHASERTSNTINVNVIRLNEDVWELTACIFLGKRGWVLGAYCRQWSCKINLRNPGNHDQGCRVPIRNFEPGRRRDGIPQRRPVRVAVPLMVFMSKAHTVAERGGLAENSVEVLLASTFQTLAPDTGRGNPSCVDNLLLQHWPD